MHDQKYIALAECVDRGVYRISSRNLSIGVYQKETKGFIGIRTKFGARYLATEFHWDTGEPFGTVTPIAQIGVLPAGISCAEQDKELFAFIDAIE